MTDWSISSFPSAHRTTGISAERKSVEIHRKGIETKNAVGEQTTCPGKVFQYLRRLNTAYDTDRRTQDPDFGTQRNGTLKRRFGKQTAETGRAVNVGERLTAIAKQTSV